MWLRGTTSGRISYPRGSISARRARVDRAPGMDGKPPLVGFRPLRRGHDVAPARAHAHRRVPGVDDPEVILHEVEVAILILRVPGIDEPSGAAGQCPAHAQRRLRGLAAPP